MPYKYVDSEEFLKDNVGYLCIDPGPEKCGFALYRNYKVIEWGHVTWAELLPYVRACAGVAMEDLVPGHRGRPIINKNMILQAMRMGALEFEARSCGKYVERMTRSCIIKSLTGKVPGRKHKVTKADMQQVVQKKLNLKEPIRPQHANDAVCVGMAVFGFPKQKAGAANNGGGILKKRKKTRRR